MKKDTIVVGALAGLIGNGVKLVIALGLYQFGLIEQTYIHIAGGYFQNHELNSIYSILNAVFSDFIYAAFLGVIICTLLRNTDMAYAKAKGILIGGFIHIIHNGVLIFEGVNKIIINDATVFFLTFPTLIYGFVTAWVIERFE